MEGFSLAAADRLDAQLRHAISMLKEHPELGHPGDLPGTRELGVARTPYVLVYAVTEKGVVVYRIIHGSRRWPPVDDE
jgi:toxin ParE1/3/4